MVITFEYRTDRATVRDEMFDAITQRAQREYRRQSGSRRQTSIWRWNQDSYLSDGSGANYRGTLVGNCPIRHRHQLGCGQPVLAEVWAYVRYDEAGM